MFGYSARGGVERPIVDRGLTNENREVQLPMSVSEATFPRPVCEITATLIDLYRHQNQPEVAELIASANAYLEVTDFDNWNGGTRTWALRLDVPVPLFASVYPRLSEIETSITERLRYLARLCPNDPIGDVTVSPLAPGVVRATPQLVPSESDVSHIWRDRPFRLFLSHVSSHRVAVSELKLELAMYGIAAFVAHEDIEPSREWQMEIELALRSMHALAALFTPDFHGSFWTDQEVGWALGRGVLALPIKLGTGPYGLAGKVQAVPGDLEHPKPLAKSIATALLGNPKTRAEMKRALVHAFADSDCYATAKILAELVIAVTDFADEQKAALHKACSENGQVRGARGVSEAIRQTFGEPPATTDPTLDTTVPL
jgi:hypothetical protein